MNQKKYTTQIGHNITFTVPHLFQKTLTFISVQFILKKYFSDKILSIAW